MSYFEEWPFHTVPGSHPEIWADRKQLLSCIKPYLEVSRKREPSKLIVVWGAFGSGKTHLLRHFEWQLVKDNKGFVVYSPFPKEKVRGFYDLYRSAFVNKMKFFTLGRISSEIWSNFVSDFGEREAYYKVVELVDEWYDFARVFSSLGMVFASKPDPNEPMLRLCKTWLSGERLYAEEKRNLGVGSDVRTDHDANRLFCALIKILSSSKSVKRVGWMLDDCHVLLTKSLERHRELVLQTLRTIYDECVENFILLLSFSCKDPDAVSEFLIPDIERRMQILEIPTLTTSDAIDFCEDLVRAYRTKDSPDTYPFSNKTCFKVFLDIIKRKDELIPGNIMTYLDRIVRDAERTIYPKLITPSFIERKKSQI